MPEPDKLNEKQPSELELAAKWFEEHPSETKYDRNLSGFASSYLKTPQGMTRLKNKSETDRVKTNGAFGKVKSTQRLPQQTTVVKKQCLSEIVTLDFVTREANINLDLGIAAGGITLREAPDKRAPDIKRRYVYEELYDLGNPLSNAIDRFAPEARLDLAIQLLLKVDALHRGDLSKSGKRYAHRDIKPDNILIDADGNLTLIDFGFSSTDLDKTNNPARGTPEYLPIDKSVFDKVKHRKEAMWEIKKTPNYLVDDRIATLRTIYNPISNFTDKSIFDQVYFSSLPQPLKTLLDTTTIAPHLSHKRRHESEHFLAAALILYKRNGNITQAEIDNIRKNTEIQDVLIKYHDRTQRNASIHSLDDERAIQLLSKAEKLLIEYKKHLSKPHPIDKKLSEEKYALISQCLNGIKDCKTSQAKLAKIDEFLCENYSTLSTAQRRAEKGLLNGLMNFFSRLFGRIKGKSVIASIEKWLDKAIGPAHQSLRAVTSYRRECGFFPAPEEMKRTPKNKSLDPP